MVRPSVCIGAIALLASCGGKVVFVDGAAGGASSTTASTGSVTGSASGSSTASGQPTSCDTFCATPPCADQAGECAAQCEELLPGCESEAAAFLTCAEANLDASSCALAAAPPTTYAPCSGERYDLLVCRYDQEHCQFANECELVSGPPHDVYCKSTCDFGALSAHCSDPDANGTFACQCSLNGSVVASCEGFVFFDEEPECCQLWFLGLSELIDTSVDE